MQGPGTFDEAGLYAAPADAAGRVDIRAVLLVGPPRHPFALAVDDSIEIVPGRPPEITALTTNFTGGSSTLLRAEVADDGGPDGLTYTWDVVALPVGATAQLYPSSDPASAMAVMTRGGSYTFRLTVRERTGWPPPARSASGTGPSTPAWR